MGRAASGQDDGKCQRREDSGKHSDSGNKYFFEVHNFIYSNQVPKTMVAPSEQRVV
jgi:hypothetical protein